MKYDLDGLTREEQLAQVKRYLKNRSKSASRDGTQDPWITDKQLLNKFNWDLPTEEKLGRLHELLEETGMTE